MSEPIDEDPTTLVRRVRQQVAVVAREADRSPRRIRGMITAGLIIDLLLTLAIGAVVVYVAVNTSGLESSGALAQRGVQRIEQNQAALDGLNVCLARAGRPTIAVAVTQASDQADALVSARGAAQALLADVGCPEAAVPAGAAPPGPPGAVTTTPAPQTTTPPSSSTRPSSAEPPFVPGAGPVVTIPIPGPGGARGDTGVPGRDGAAGGPAPGGGTTGSGPAPSGRDPAPRPLIPLLPEPLLPPLI